MSPRHPFYEYSFIKRTHVLFTSLITLAGACLYLVPDFPFPVGFLGVCIASSIFHLVIFLLFNQVTPLVFTVINVTNLFMLSLAVHFTGGILSPYTMIFALVLISAAGYGMNMPVALGISIGSYAGIIISEKLGVLPPAQVTALQIYGSWPATLLVLFSVVGFMAISGSIYKATVNRLKYKIANEMEIKQTLANRLASLDAPSQVGLLVHKIAHDIIGPMAAVTGLLKIIKDTPALPGKAGEDLTVAVEELQRVNRLVGRMQEYVKPGRMEREKLELRDVLETVFSVVSFLPAAMDVKLVCDEARTTELIIEANKNEMQQVFFNILKNAVEAFPRDSSEKIIRIGFSKEGEFAVVTVSDNGPGFPEHVVRHLGRAMVSTKPQGSGIGLLIVREVIEAYNGKFTVKNHPAGGAVVTMCFPLVKAQLPLGEVNSKTG